MKAAALLLALLAADARAATAYVTDELVLGVYSAQNTQGQRLTTLHSGAVVETLTTAGDSTEVRLPDGTTGWVKTVYLTNAVPAVVRIKQLQEELDRSRATTPALAEAAAHSEVERLTRELAQLRAAAADAPVVAGASAADPAATTPATAARDPRRWWWLPALVSLLVGFWSGYATLARRIKSKFGGIKVY